MRVFCAFLACVRVLLLDVSFVGALGVKDFTKELVVLMRLRHAHIVTFYGIYQHFYTEGGGTLSDRCGLACGGW